MIYVTGTESIARELRALLTFGGAVVLDDFPYKSLWPTFVVVVEAGEAGRTVVRGVNAPYTHNVAECAGELASNVLVEHTPLDNVLADRKVMVTVGGDSNYRHNVLLGIKRGLDKTLQAAPQPQPKRFSLALMAALLAIAFLLGVATRAVGQSQNIRSIGGTTQSGANVIDAGNSAVKVNCIIGCGASGGLTNTELRASPVPVSGTFWQTIQPVSSAQLPAALGGAGGLKVECLSGCGGAATFADNSAFTFGTTSIGNMGAVVDDTATNTVAENSAGAPRMTVQRGLHVNLRTNGGVEIPFPAALGANGGFKIEGVASGVAVPISGTVTTTPPANASTNVAQLAGTATSVNSGTKDAGTLRVVLATDQPQLTNKLLVTPDSVALPANQSVNVAQLAGTTTDTNSGTKSAGTLRVVLATDQPALTNKLLVTPDSVALPANQSVNTAQFGGTNVSTGTGAGGVGIPRVTISNDSSLAANQSVNLNQIAGSAIATAATGSQKVGVTGNAGAAFDAANNAAAPANVVVDGFETATQTTTQPTAATAGNVRRAVTSTDGSLYVRPHGPVIWSCGLSAIGTTLTQCQAAPGAGLRLYITDITAQSNTATAGLFTVRFGTGANCVTGTGNVFFASATALIAAPANTAPPNNFNFISPIAITAANAICVLGVVTNTTNIQINGYTAP